MKTRGREGMLFVAALVGSAAMICCGSGVNGSHTSDGSAGNTVEVTPPSSDVPIDVGDAICLTFSSALDPATVTIDNFTVEELGGTSVCTEIQASQNNTRFCCLHSALRQHTTYTVGASDTIKTASNTNITPSTTSITTNCTMSDSFADQTLVGDSANYPQCWTMAAAAGVSSTLSNFWSIVTGNLVFMNAGAIIFPSSLGGNGLMVLEKKVTTDTLTVTLKIASFSNFNTSSINGNATSDGVALVFLKNEAVTDNLYQFGIGLTSIGSVLSCKALAGMILNSSVVVGQTGGSATNPCNLADGPLWLRITRSSSTFTASYKVRETDNYTQLYSGTTDGDGASLTTAFGTSYEVGIKPFTADTGATRIILGPFTVE